MKIAEPKHSPDGEKRRGADAASLGGPLVMQNVMQIPEKMKWPHWFSNCRKKP